MNKQKRITTLSEFLLHAGTEYLVLDLGRGRELIDNQTFFEIELNQQRFPRPRQRFAWLSILFWNKQASQEHYIWYLKFPIDERGLLQSAARDQFLQLLVERLGEQLDNNEQMQKGLPDNPFAFEPSQQMRADCNALFKHHLNIALSKEAELAKAYLLTPAMIDWQTLSVQNIADAIMSLTSEEITGILGRLSQYPHAVMNCLLSGIEGLTLTTEQSLLLEAFVLNQRDYTQALGLRAMAKAELDIRSQLIDQLIQSEQGLDMELLVVIVGRHWSCLNDESRLRSYLEQVLVHPDADELFMGIFSDLVMLPDLRASVLSLLSTESNSPILQEKLNMIKQRMYQS